MSDVKRSREEYEKNASKVAVARPVKKAVPKKAEAEPVRHFKGETEVNHDLFKLEMSYFKKNLGLPHSPRWENTEHAHYFHTVDSNGKPMQYSSAIGGHCHEVSVKVLEDGRLVATCGKPVKRYKNNKVEQLPTHDDHTHDVSYLFSEKVKARRLNEKAQAHIDLYNSKLQ